MDRTKELVEDFKGITSRYSTHPRDLYDNTPNEKEYEEVMLEARAIFLERNKLYGDTFKILGLLGCLPTLIGDVWRIKNMVIPAHDHGRANREQVRDKLLDIINQAALCLIVLSENNFEGK